MSLFHLGPYAFSDHYAGVPVFLETYERLPEEVVVEYMNEHLSDLVQDDLG